MSVVKARDAKNEASSIVFDFKDIAAEASAMLDAARKESKRIIETANKEITQKQNKIFSEAREKGYAEGKQKGYEDAYSPAEKKGYDDGYAKAFEDVRQRFEHLMEKPFEDVKKIMDYFESGKRQLMWEAEQSFVVLAVKLAEKLIRERLEVDRSLVARTLRAALETVAETTNVVIRLNPDDIKIIEDLKGSLSDVLGRFESIELRADESVSCGGCIVQNKRGKVDARIETQLQRLSHEIIEPGACLEIADEEETPEFDKLIGEPSKQSETDLQKTAEDETVLTEAADAAAEIEAAVENLEAEVETDETELTVDDAVLDELPEASEPQELQDQAGMEMPPDQAEKLRRQMNQKQDDQE